ncbi:MAG: DUF3592 domain-containing protein [Myxococcaceae bacterium]
MNPRVLRLIAFGCLALGAAFMVERLIFVAQSQAAVGEVSVTDVAHYTVRFESEGKIVEVTRPLPADADERQRLKLGQKLALRFRPNAPQDARVFGLDFWFFPVGMLLVGVLGVFAARYTRRAPTQPLS